MLSFSFFVLLSSQFDYLLFIYIKIEKGVYIELGICIEVDEYDENVNVEWVVIYDISDVDLELQEEAEL